MRLQTTLDKPPVKAIDHDALWYSQWRRWDRIDLPYQRERRPEEQHHVRRALLIERSRAMNGQGFDAFPWLRSKNEAA